MEQKVKVSDDEEEEENDNEDEYTKKKYALPKMVLCTAQTKYRVVKKSCRKLDFKLNGNLQGDWDLYWSDTGI